MPTDGRGEVGWDEGVDVGREVDLETQHDFGKFREIRIYRGVMDAKLVQGWKLVINERSCGNFGDRAGSERGEGGWRW